MTPLSPFELRLPQSVRFGRGAALAAVPEILRFGARVLVVHGRDPGRSSALRDALDAVGAVTFSVACPGEPTLPMLTAALEEGRARHPDTVVAVGGGAALDLGKALAALLPAVEDPLVHLEVVGQGKPLSAAPLPCVAIPTTAGTGSEATKNAVIGVPEAARKVSLRDARMVPDLAVIDPSLTDGTPVAQTLASGLDAVTQVIEPYLCTRATPFTDALARPAIEMGLHALVALVEEGENPGARDRLAYVAHVSGIALANAGLGAVHGLAGVLGGETGASHGVICARLLPRVLHALRASDALDQRTQLRLAEVCALIDAIVPGGLDGMEGWLTRNGVARLPALSAADRERIAGAAQAASSMKASPVAFSARALADLLNDASPVP
ncbi:MAG: iron-containing alcohol dehydrogenase [Pseudomonadota bacterium]